MNECKSSMKLLLELNVFSFLLGEYFLEFFCFRADDEDVIARIFEFALPFIDLSFEFKDTTILGEQTREFVVLFSELSHETIVSSWKRNTNLFRISECSLECCILFSERRLKLGDTIEGVSWFLNLSAKRVDYEILFLQNLSEACTLIIFIAEFSNLSPQLLNDGVSISDSVRESIRFLLEIRVVLAEDLNLLGKVGDLNLWLTQARFGVLNRAFDFLASTRIGFIDLSEKILDLSVSRGEFLLRALEGKREIRSLLR